MNRKPTATAARTAILTTLRNKAEEYGLSPDELSSICYVVSGHPFDGMSDAGATLTLQSLIAKGADASRTWSQEIRGQKRMDMS